MYPNYQPYQNQQPQQPNPNNNRMQPPQYTHQQNGQPQQNYLIPPQNNNNPNHIIHSSNIQAPYSATNSNKPAGFGFGKLESMGRFIQEAPEASSKNQQAPVGSSSQFGNTLNFKNDKNEKAKMSSSVIFFKNNNDEDLNHFPSFNVGSNNNTTGGLSRLEALMKKPKPTDIPKEQGPIETPQEKRKKQILSIKQQLDFLNKKMENTVFKKTEPTVDGDNKPYFQLPSRKVANTPVQPTTMEGNKGFFQQYSGHDNSKSQTTTQNKGLYNQFTATDYSKTQATYNSKLTNPNPSTQSYQLPHTYTTPQVKPYSSPLTNIQSQSQNYSTPSNSSGSSWSSSTSTSQNSYQVPTTGGEVGGMFKKKNPYLIDEAVKPLEHQQKNFMLSPKGNNTASIAKPSQPIYQAKPAEVIEPPKPKKGMRRTDSFEDEKPKMSNQEGPRAFKKSDFAIGKKLGKGQYGQVCLVIHKDTGFLCGLKVMSKKQIRQEKYENQIARQLSINFFLSHRNVAPLYGYFSDQQNVYLLIEYCTNGQLLSMLRKNHRMQQPQVSPIIRQICQGLDYIHKQQIIHRDIKPQNILFNFNTVKICDFGWAVYSGNGMRKTVSGSPLYYSPQVVMETEYDQKIDIWAVGMMTYQCILGKIPFRIYSELDLNRIVEDEIKFPEYIDVSDQAKDFILKIMKKNPEERMEIKEIMRHPFITKYLKEKKVGNEVLQEFRKVLSA